MWAGNLKSISSRNSYNTLFEWFIKINLVSSSCISKNNTDLGCCIWLKVNIKPLFLKAMRNNDTGLEVLSWVYPESHFYILPSNVPENTM